MTYRILITGSRTWDDITYIRSVFVELDNSVSEDVRLLSGACPTGADRLGEMVATELGWDIELYPADWNTHGRKAGFVRNAEMVDSLPNLVIGFVRNKSKGASMTVNLSRNKGIHTIVHGWTDYPFTCYDVKSFNQPNEGEDSLIEDTLF